MPERALIGQVIDICNNNEQSGPHYSTAVPGFSLMYDVKPGGFEAVVYDPVVCLILQGGKETRIGNHRVVFGAGDSLIVSHSLPVVAAITEASPDKPYIALVLAIDFSIVRSLYDEIGDVSAGQVAHSAVAASTSAALIDAFARLLQVSQHPLETETLAPLILREIHFRLLQADHGEMLRQMVWRDSSASRIGRVMTQMRSELANSLSVPEMASMAGMSVSAFHEHFKLIAGTTPLQYHKALRLTEARRLIVETTNSISRIAYEVGYQSPTQFSREYARKFGNSPRQDVVRMKIE